MPNVHGAFPWINHPGPLLPENQWFLDNLLMIGDAGCIYIAIDDKKHLHWTDSCF
ncbi:MAG TPA: hypothetical protein VG125_17770 [Pirellulales bacterium]|jgi:hypothetical protein|nr:hypothetical protein [Pirellulales bacterium]